MMAIPVGSVTIFKNFSPMDYRLLDEKILHPVSDVVQHNNKTIVACYDGSLRAYSGNTLLSTAYLPTPITRMCSYFENVLAISMTSGLLYVFDSNLVLIDVIGKFPKPNIIFKAGQKVVILCYSGLAYLLQEKTMPLSESKGFQEKTYSIGDVEAFLVQPHVFEVLGMREHPKTPTSGTYYNGKVAISFENTLVITDEELKESYSKEFGSCINSVSFYDGGVLVGLISGKIHCENFCDPSESFVFNSHVDSKPDKKTFFPNTQLLYGKHLYSSGADGRIIKWDLENKKQVSTIFQGKSCVRKFVPSGSRMLILLDDIFEMESPSKLVYATFEM